MNNNPASPRSEIQPSGWRYYTGWFFFVLCFIMPLSTLFIPMLGFNKSMTTVLMGLFMFGLPEVFMVIAIALWGRATFDYFIGRIYMLFKRLAPSARVSPTRYYIGLALLFSSFIPSWILSYFPHIVSNMTRIYIVFGFDIVFVISFFVLGGDFWDKVQSLFNPNPISTQPE